MPVRPPHLRARRSSRPRRRPGASPTSARDLGDFVEATNARCPSSQEILRNPQLDKRAKTAAVDAVAGESDSLVLQPPPAARREGAGRRASRRSAEEFERLAAAEEGELSVELTTAYELSDDETRAIVGQIEQRSGRKVEATRAVDPDLIGGMVLQVGSRRVDASIRGRIEQLGRELRTGA